MKDYQFEEITAALSIIICLLAYRFEIRWLFLIYVFKASLDTLCALWYAYKSYKNEQIKK